MRVIVESITFEELVDSAFNEIRQYARSDTAVTIHLIEALGAISAYTDNSRYQTVLQCHARIILQSAMQALPDEQDRYEVQERPGNIASLKMIKLVSLDRTNTLMFLYRR
ncbi:DUF2254 family protein [Tolypothrix bouteillei VB521301_2]